MREGYLRGELSGVEFFSDSVGTFLRENPFWGEFYAYHYKCTKFGQIIFHSYSGYILGMFSTSKPNKLMIRHIARQRSTSDFSTDAGSKCDQPLYYRQRKSLTYCMGQSVSYRAYSF